MEEFDVDALLDAQSSDEDDGDLPELGRSIDDILNDADASEDDFLQVSVSSGELDKDGEKTANCPFDVSSRPPRNLSISSSKDSAGPGVRRTTTFNSETTSQEMILHGTATRDIDNNDKVESDSGLPGIEQHNLKLDQDKNFGHDRSIVSPDIPFNGSVAGLQVSVSMKNQRMWEFGSKSPALGAGFSFYPVSSMVAPRPSPRPGAAVAAAAAASRHLVSPRLNSRAATYSRSGSAINRSSIPDNSQLVAGTPDSTVRDVSNQDVELLITEYPKITQDDSENTVNLQEESTELASFVSVSIAGETVDEANDKSQGSITEVQAEDSVVVDLPAPSAGLQEEEFKEETWTADATTSDITAVDVAEDDTVDVQIINEKLARDNKVDELITSSSQESSETETVFEPVGVHENAFEVVHPAQPHSPLHEAEELEKWAANSGLHLEEGAAAQPMQLEGIQRGPPAIGLLQLDCGGPLSFALSSIAMMRDHGSPRALAVHANFLAVGMSKGTVLLAPSKYSATRAADDNETKVVLLSNATDKSHASVSVLCFSHLGDLLLAGYSNGSVTLWDVTKAAVAKAVTGEHHSVIVHAAFIGQDASTGRQLKVITADSKGVVLLHTFTLVPLLRRFSVTTQCLLDGQRTGIVLSLSPLLPDESTISSVGSNAALSIGGAVSGTDVGRKFLYDGSSADEAGGLVVFVTQQIALVFRLVPTLEICAKLTRPDGVGEGSVPYTSWRRVPSKSTVSESSNANSGISKAADSDKISAMENSTQAQDNNFPLLALAWGKKVLILQLQKAELKTLVQWDLDSKAAGVAWLSEQMLIVATAKAELCLFTKGGLELERAAIREDQGGLGALIFHTYFLDSCNNPEKVYANSIGVRGAAFYFLGPSKLWRARLLPWQDRIKALQDAGDWMGAFQIAMELYDGRARGVTGLPTGLRAMQEALMPNLLALLSAYIDEAFAYVRLALGLPNHSSTDLPVEDADSLIQVAREQYARVGGVAIEFCVHMHRTDVLFENVFRKFEAVGQAATFLELLEPYILKDMLGGLPPEIMQSLVVHYSSRGWLQRVEQCILHMDISSLDFNQVMRLCREHGLFSALIYLFNKGLDDFKSPLEELLVAAQDQSRPNARYIGYKLLVYLKYCFSGLAFPPGRGFLPPGKLDYLKAQLLEYLLDPEGSVKDAAMTDSVNVAYPRLCYLLNLDVIATLDVLKMAFNNGSLSDGINQAVEKDLVQLMVDALVHIVETVLCMEAASELKIGHVLEFIASFVSTRVACIPPTTLHRILEHFCLDVTPKSSSSDQEDLMVALLKAVPPADWNPDFVLQLAEKAHFWQVSALVHTREGDHTGALSSYLKDLSRPYHTFSYVLSMLDAEDGLKSTALADFRAAVIARIPQLVQQSREATLFLVLEYFYDEVKDIMKTLESFPMSLFYFLKAVMEVQSYHVEPAPDVSHMDPEVVENTEAWNKHKDEPWSDHARLASLLDRSYLEISDEMVELYIQLMCQLEPNSVLKFLQSYESYRLEQCLKLCQKYGVKDGAAFLLERVGDVGSALALVLADLTRLMHDLDNAVAVIYSSASNALLEEIPEAKAIHAVGDAAISLCQRNTFRLDHQEAESLWFHLLDRFVHPLQRLVSSKRKAQLPVKERNSHHKWQVLETEGGAGDVLRRMLSKFVGDIVTGMLGYVPLHVILNKIISDHGNHEFGDFKGTILEMLSAYGYELAILGTAKRIIEADMFHNIVALRRGSARGFAPRIPMCCVCNHAFDEDHSVLTNDEKQKGIGDDRNTGNLGLAIQIFSCGHAVHVDCMDAGKMKSNSLRCPACLLHETGAYPTTSGSILREKQVRKSEQPAEGQSNTPVQRTLQAAPESNEISRFELLQSLQKGQGLPETNAGLRLNLSPPVVNKNGSNAARSSNSSYSQRSVQLTVQPKQQGKGSRVPSMFQLAGIGSQK